MKKRVRFPAKFSADLGVCEGSTLNNGDLALRFLLWRNDNGRAEKAEVNVSFGDWGVSLIAKELGKHVVRKRARVNEMARIMAQIAEQVKP